MDLQGVPGEAMIPQPTDPPFYVRAASGLGLWHRRRERWGTAHGIIVYTGTPSFLRSADLPRSTACRAVEHTHLYSTLQLLPGKRTPLTLLRGVIMASSSNNSPLEALRGDAERMFELVFETGTARQWGELLKAPLECAVLRGDEDMVQKLVWAGASMGASVHAAVESGREQMMDYLLTHGGSVHIRDPSGDTPPVVAGRTGRAELARSLLLRGARVNAPGKADGTPLFWAAQNGHLAVVEELIEAGADVTRRFHNLISPIETAAEHGHADVVRALIEGGSDVNCVGLDGRTAVKSAVLSLGSEVIDVLVEAGANIEPRDVMGCIPLHVAVMQEGGLDANSRPAEAWCKRRRDGDAIPRRLHTAAHLSAQGRAVKAWWRR